jgi:hypothetical protein
MVAFVSHLSSDEGHRDSLQKYWLRKLGQQSPKSRVNICLNFV